MRYDLVEAGGAGGIRCLGTKRITESLGAKENPVVLVLGVERVFQLVDRGQDRRKVRLVNNRDEGGADRRLLGRTRGGDDAGGRVVKDENEPGPDAELDVGPRHELHAGSADNGTRQWLS